jgi:hypothetical protein
LVDIIILAESELEVAGQHSYISQTVPLFFQLSKAVGLSRTNVGGLDCNATSELGTTVTLFACFGEFGEWMARKSKFLLIWDPAGETQDCTQCLFTQYDAVGKSTSLDTTVHWLVSCYH